MSKDTPGPFRMHKFGWTIERLCPGPLPGEEERYLDHNILKNEWLVAQLNRAAHFEGMLAQLKRTRQGQANLLDLGWISNPGHRESVREVIAEIDAEIAKAEGKGDE